MNPNLTNEKKKINQNIDIKFNVTNCKEKIYEESIDEQGSQSSSKDNKGEFKNGRWQPFEHLRFIKGCLLYGNNWKKVSNI
jgi:hypothetical protein